jgi:hypothetical protein
VIRVILPYHLRNLAGVEKEVRLEIAGPVTARSILDALEAGCTMRDHATGARRPMLRYFAAGEDLSFDPADAVLPPEVANGAEPFRIVGAIAGG